MTYEKLTHFVLLQRWMQENELDCFTLTSSPKGFGKSTFSLQATRRYQSLFGLKCENGHAWISDRQVLERLGGTERSDVPEELVVQPCPECGKTGRRDTRYVPKRYLAYDGADMERMIYDSRPYLPILGDEAVRWLMGEDWAKSESKRMKKLFAQMRTKRFLVYGNIPKFRWSDSKYRNDMTTFWVRILKRGMAVIMQPDLGEADDPWHLKKFDEILGSYFYTTSDEELERKAEKLKAKHPCVLDVFRIPPLPEDLYREYQRSRDEKAFEREETESFDQKYAAKVMAYNLYTKFHDLVHEVENGWGKRLSYRLISEYLLEDPKSGDLLAKEGAVRLWITEARRMAGKSENKE